MAPLSMVRSSVTGYLVLFLVTLLIAWWQGRLPALFPMPAWPSTGIHALIGIVLAVAVLSAGAAFRGTFVWARRLEDEFRILLAGIGPRGALLLAVSSGVAEEAFFRGTMQPALGLAPTSLVFGLLHYPVNRRMIPWTVIAVAIGFVLGIVYEQTGSLLTVALAHGLINFVELMGLSRSHGRQGPPEP